MFHELLIPERWRNGKKRINADPDLCMFKWYVTRGYPLQALMDSTFAERVLLREAMKDYMEMWEKTSEEVKDGIKNSSNSINT